MSVTKITTHLERRKAKTKVKQSQLAIPFSYTCEHLDTPHVNSMVVALQNHMVTWENSWEILSRLNMLPYEPVTPLLNIYLREIKSPSHQSLGENTYSIPNYPKYLTQNKSSVLSTSK